MKLATLLLLGICTAAIHSSATPLLPYFAPVRSEITNQMTIISNTVPLNKKLLGVLKGALTQIDKPGPANLANDIKLLNVVVPAIAKTTVSNVFHSPLDGAVNNYLQ